MLLTLLLACIPADDAFYDDPVVALDANPPGTMLRSEFIADAHHAHVYRILYSTTGLDGRPDVASARVAIPDEPNGTIQAHLHGTVGLADACAPSRAYGFGFESAVNPNADAGIDRGFVVVEPDYLGIGPEGPHPYLVADPTGTSVLDAIRAVSGFADPDHDVAAVQVDEVLLEGHSQGGHAVLATLRVAPTYAPEIPIAAAVAIAPPGAASDALSDLVSADASAGFVALALLGELAARPELGDPGDFLLDPDLASEAESKCLISLPLGRPADELLQPEVADAARAADWDAIGLGQVLADEDLGTLRTGVPLRIVHGTDDPLLPIALTEALADRIGADFVPIEGGDHLMLPRAARDEVWSFLDERPPLW